MEQIQLTRHITVAVHHNLVVLLNCRPGTLTDEVVGLFGSIPPRAVGAVQNNDPCNDGTAAAASWPPITGSGHRVGFWPCCDEVLAVLCG